MQKLEESGRLWLQIELWFLNAEQITQNSSFSVPSGSLIGTISSAVYTLVQAKTRKRPNHSQRLPAVYYWVALLLLTYTATKPTEPKERTAELDLKHYYYYYISFCWWFYPRGLTISAFNIYEGPLRGSSCPRTLRHADEGDWGLNCRPSSWTMTTLPQPPPLFWIRHYIFHAAPHPGTQT